MFIYAFDLIVFMAFQQPTENRIFHRFEGREASEVAKWLVNANDVFNWNHVYLMLHDWLVEEGWASADDSDFPEKYYLMRDVPGFGKEMWLRWQCEKVPEMYSDGAAPFTYAMDVVWHCLGVAGTEVGWKGQKVKMNKGELELEVTAYVVIDKKKLWKGAWGKVKEVLLKKQMKKVFEKHKKTVYEDAYRLRALLSNYLKIESFQKEKEGAEPWGRRSLD
jgi:hypothetical protein